MAKAKTVVHLFYHRANKRWLCGSCVSQGVAKRAECVGPIVEMEPQSEVLWCAACGQWLPSDYTPAAAIAVADALKNGVHFREGVEKWRPVAKALGIRMSLRPKAEPVEECPATDFWAHFEDAYSCLLDAAPRAPNAQLPRQETSGIDGGVPAAPALPTADLRARARAARAQAVAWARKDDTLVGVYVRNGLVTVDRVRNRKGESPIFTADCTSVASVEKVYDDRYFGGSAVSV